MHRTTADDGSPAVRLRRLGPSDLDPINAVIEAAVMSWKLPERLKRLSLGTCRYGEADLRHLTLVGADDAARRIVGIAAWEPAAARDVPRDTTALALHGLYVHPALHGHGVGTRLLEAAIAAAREAGVDGLLVKAVREAQAFFRSRGLRSLPIEDPARDYPYRLWWDSAAGNGQVADPATRSDVAA